MYHLFRSGHCQSGQNVVSGAALAATGGAYMMSLDLQPQMTLVAFFFSIRMMISKIKVAETESGDHLACHFDLRKTHRLNPVPDCSECLSHLYRFIYLNADLGSYLTGMGQAGSL